MKQLYKILLFVVCLVVSAGSLLGMEEQAVPDYSTWSDEVIKKRLEELMEISEQQRAALSEKLQNEENELNEELNRRVKSFQGKQKAKPVDKKPQRELSEQPRLSYFERDKGPQRKRPSSGTHGTIRDRLFESSRGGDSAAKKQVSALQEKLAALKRAADSKKSKKPFEQIVGESPEKSIGDAYKESELKTQASLSEQSVSAEQKKLTGIESSKKEQEKSWLDKVGEWLTGAPQKEPVEQSTKLPRGIGGRRTKSESFSAKQIRDAFKKEEGLNLPPPPVDEPSVGNDLAFPEYAPGEKAPIRPPTLKLPETIREELSTERAKKRVTEIKEKKQRRAGKNQERVLKNALIRLHQSLNQLSIVLSHGG